MKTALLLIDLQNDYLAAPVLQPAAGQVVHKAAELLAHFRQSRLPVIHIRTTVTRRPDNRMPHWKEKRRWICVAGTPGHAFAPTLAPGKRELIFNKQYFSAFQDGNLIKSLRRANVTHVVLVGVHLHACVRATALDAYALGFNVLIAEGAIASDDPLHAAMTRRYLGDRGIRFGHGFECAQPTLPGTKHPSAKSAPRSSRRLLTHQPPAGAASDIWTVRAKSPASVASLAHSAHQHWCQRVKITPRRRAAFLRKVADLLLQQEKSFAKLICNDVGKPISMARGEVQRSAALLRATADLESDASEFQTSPSALCHRRPLGVIAAITPWNNPLAIPIGKIAPAWFYDNAVLWKPSPPGTRIASLFHDVWTRAGGDHLHSIPGDAASAAQLAADPHVAGVSLSGSAAAGMALVEITARRHIPYQAELGGNNAAIMWKERDPLDAARRIAEGAFSFAGQRCTANRRVIVPAAKLHHYLDLFINATRELHWGNPQDEATTIGPVISIPKADELRALLHRAVGQGVSVIHPHLLDGDAFKPNAAYIPPALVTAMVPSLEIVQEESFGPILVVQPARDFDEAMTLCNGVRQGLAAALFSTDNKLQRRFLREAQAGILKINQATADADAVSPFGGWKASGIGPAEHGIADREFFTRLQTVYGQT